MRIFALFLALTLFVPSCANEGPTCPSEFKVGEECLIEYMECPYPGSLCSPIMCKCTNAPGGLYWVCEETKFCKCTCPCGKVAVSSCETLGCAQAHEPCPSSAKSICDIVCLDAGTPDAGTPDVGTPDAGQDGGHDASRDQMHMDLSRDQTSDQPHDTPPAWESSPAPDASAGGDS